MEEQAKLKRHTYVIAGVVNRTGKVSCTEDPVQHATLTAAQNEAERLAKAYPDKSFVVLQVMGTCVVKDVQWK